MLVLLWDLGLVRRKLLKKTWIDKLMSPEQITLIYMFVLPVIESVILR